MEMQFPDIILRCPVSFPLHIQGKMARQQQTFTKDLS